MRRRTNPKGVKNGYYRIVLGGSCHSFGGHCLSSNREWIGPNYSFVDISLRFSLGEKMTRKRVNPTGLRVKKSPHYFHIARGSSWTNRGLLCKSITRAGFRTDYDSDSGLLGFRIIVSWPQNGFRGSLSFR